MTRAKEAKKKAIKKEMAELRRNLREIAEMTPWGIQDHLNGPWYGRRLRELEEELRSLEDEVSYEDITECSIFNSCC